MKTLLFVCTGNLCRSPMAEGLCRDAAAKLGKYRAISAGVGAINGLPPTHHSVRAVKELGIDISQQRSQMLTAELVREADLILGMTESHVEAIFSLYPEAEEKTYLLGDFEDNLAPHEREVPDPIGSSYSIYVHCRDRIQRGVLTLLDYLESQDNAQTQSQPPRTMIAVASDHAGVDLKNHLKKHLEASGLEVNDLGTSSSDSIDYPDFAQAAARVVSSGAAPLAVLVCGSGSGMAITANKFPGVRAVVAPSEEIARLAREHNHANVLCLGARFTSPALATKILDTFLTTTPLGERHERRVAKIEHNAANPALRLASVDPEIFAVIEKERHRQQTHIELIASENFTSPAVMEAQGSVLTNKYAEGYPGKRWYGGCEFVDVAEQLAIDRAKRLFGAEHANVQPHSGSSANMAVYFAFLKPGDKILTMDLSHGGHLTHGNKANFSGKFFEVVHYGVRPEDERLDYEIIARLAREHRPRMITVGASAYPQIIDFARLGEIAREVGAYLLADIAHIAGLVAAGIHPSPIEHADFVTTTTHKTLRGPRGGLVLCKAKYAKEIDSQAFPGIQGGPLMHVIAAKAVCLHEALQPSFKAYQQQIVSNAAALAQGLQQNGYRLVSGGTANHLMLVDVGARGLTGKECQLALDVAGITVNKNTIPFETRSPFQASGVRLGTPAVTTRGMKEREMAAIADMISEVLMDIKNVDAAQKVRERVIDLTASFPLPY